MPKRDIYRAIMIASANSRGLHLAADEVMALALDDAIETRANNSLTEAEVKAIPSGGFAREDWWAKASPIPPGPPFNIMAGGPEGDRR